MLAVSLLFALQPLNPVQTQTDDTWLRSAGVQMIHLSSPSGSATVYLPTDMMAGDRISGSVFADPNVKVTIGSKTVGGAAVGFSVEIPSDATNLHVCADGASDAAGCADLSLMDGTRSNANFMASPIANQGAPLRVLGDFDGNSASTVIRLDGRAVGVLTETPRGATVTSAGLGLGRHDVSVQERGSEALSSQFNVVFAHLLSAKRHKKDAIVSFAVDGLDGVPETAFPLSLNISNQSPTMISAGLSGVGMRVPILSSDVKGGTWKGTGTVKLIRTGTFQMVLGVISPKFAD